MSVTDQDVFDLETVDRIVEAASKKKIEPFEVICPECGKSWKAYWLGPPTEEDEGLRFLDAALFEQPIGGLCEECSGGPWPQAAPFAQAKA